jgi:hypothetical protein
MKLELLKISCQGVQESFISKCKGVGWSSLSLVWDDEWPLFGGALTLKAAKLVSTGLRLIMRS